MLIIPVIVLIIWFILVISKCKPKRKTTDTYWKCMPSNKFVKEKQDIEKLSDTLSAIFVLLICIVVSAAFIYKICESNPQIRFGKFEVSVNVKPTEKPIPPYKSKVNTDILEKEIVKINEKHKSDSLLQASKEERINLLATVNDGYETRRVKMFAQGSSIDTVMINSLVKQIKPMTMNLVNDLNKNRMTPRETLFPEIESIEVLK